MNVVQLITGALGSVGFGLIFNMRRRYLPLAAGGGFLAWLVYLLTSQHLWSGYFLPMLAAGFAAAVYAEIMARICKAPSTLFFMTGAVPLIPGSTLYYCIYSLVMSDLAQAEVYGVETFVSALAIAAGMSIAWSFCDFFRKVQAACRRRGIRHPAKRRM